MHAAIHPLASASAPDRRQLRRVAAGVVLSLVVHALLLAFYHQPHPASAPAPAAALTIHLRAAPPSAPPAPSIVLPTPPATPAHAARDKPAKRSRPVIAVAPETRQSTTDTYAIAPAPATTPPPDATPSTAPHFDMNVARGLARKFANDPDPAKIGTALERLPPKPLETETKLARGIQAAKRGNCKDGVPGGLLAPVFLLMDKKDSGCKW